LINATKEGTSTAVSPPPKQNPFAKHRVHGHSKNHLVIHATIIASEKDGNIV
jgi:hypothetical protein